MKILDRYIFYELIKTFIISVGGITLVLYLRELLFLADLLARKSVSLWEILLLMFYMAPPYLVLTIPMSVLLASVIVFNQFFFHNEWAAIRTCHWSFWRLLKPVIYFSFAAYILTSSIFFFAIHWGNQAYKALTMEIILTQAPLDFKPGVFNRELKNLVIRVNKKNSDSVFQGVFVAEHQKLNKKKLFSRKKAF